jgi:hypothetical protein
VVPIQLAVVPTPAGVGTGGWPLSLQNGTAAMRFICLDQSSHWCGACQCRGCLGCTQSVRTTHTLPGRGSLLGSCTATHPTSRPQKLPKATHLHLFSSDLIRRRSHEPEETLMAAIHAIFAEICHFLCMGQPAPSAWEPAGRSFMLALPRPSNGLPWQRYL